MWPQINDHVPAIKLAEVVYCRKGLGFFFPFSPASSFSNFVGEDSVLEVKWLTSLGVESSFSDSFSKPSISEVEGPTSTSSAEIKVPGFINPGWFRALDWVMGVQGTR